jgi:aspartate kinase
MFRALADADINIQMITTSEIKISVLVKQDVAQTALRAAHAAFGLHKVPKNLTSRETTSSQADEIDVVSQLQTTGMEDLAIDDISLDDTQARVTILGVPNTPGIAAGVFEQVAKAGIFVDMIVQSYDSGDLANLSFTVPRDMVDRAVVVANAIAVSMSCNRVTSSPQVAKLSVSGIGLRSHTGVAIRMFRALAEAHINVEMINTSEVRVNVVVEGSRGREALTCLRRAFADSMQ